MAVGLNILPAAAELRSVSGRPAASETKMAKLDHIIRQAARRQLLNRALRLGGVGAAVGAAVGLVLLGVDRLGSVAMPWWVFAGLCAAGLIAGVAAALMRRPDALDVAARLDHVLRLRDRLGTAVAVQRGLIRLHRDEERGFAALTVADADRVAGRISARAAVPIRLTNIWNVSLVLWAALALGVVVLPRASWGDSPEQMARQQQLQQELEQEATALRESIQSTVDELEAGAADDPRVAEQLDALRELERQLAGGDLNQNKVAEAQDESAARFNELADRLDEQAERDHLARQELAREFEKLEPTKAPPSTRELIEQLRDGDLNNVADELQRLLEQSQQLDETQRQQAAESLRSTSEALGKENVETADAGESLQQLEQFLRDQGLDEPAIDALTADQPPRTQRELAEELMSRGVDEPAARELAERLHDRQQQRDAQEQAAQDRQALREALERAAQQLDPQAETPEDVPPAAQPDQPADQPRTDDSPREQTQPQQDSDPQDAQRSAEQSQQPSDETGEPKQQPSKQTSEQRPAQSPKQQPTGQQQQQQPEQQPQSQSGSSQQGAEQQRDAQPDESAAPQQQPEQQTGDTEQTQQQRPVAEPSTDPADPQTAQPTPDPNQQPQAQPSPQPTQQPTDQQQSPQPGESAEQSQQSQQPQSRKSPAEIIRELQQRRDAVERWRNLSEQSKQRARELADRMSDEQKQRWARELQRQLSEQELRELMREADDAQPPLGPAGSRAGTEPGDKPQSDQPSTYTPEGTETVDSRGDDEGADQIISEWLSDQPRPGEPETVRRPDDAEPVRRAQDFARRAVNESAVPRRYHPLIDRYFGRLPQAVEDASAQTPSKDSESGAESAGAPNEQ